MKTVQANDPRPASVQIADDLRSRIEGGEFAPGAKLPSIRELAAGYGVASMTAQAALQRLRDERLAYSSGRGHFVGAGPSGNSQDLAKRLEELETEVRDLRSRVESIESAQ
jgi:DNA-binding GntR family transcriptional regulator